MSKEQQDKVENKECECENKDENSSEKNISSENTETESLKKELKECKGLLLRTAAEYDNFRKRSEKEKGAMYADALSLAVLGILPLADSLDAAAKLAENGGEEYKKGIELLKNQMASALKSLNVESFGDVGDEFDPSLHNAIAHKEDENAEQNVISNIFQKGYKMGDRIIRHAMVEVTN